MKKTFLAFTACILFFSQVVTSNANFVAEESKKIITVPSSREEYRIQDFQMSPNGHAAYRVHDKDQYFVVLDGIEGPKFDGIEEFKFMLDGKTVMYHALSGEYLFMVLQDVNGVTKLNIEGLPVSALDPLLEPHKYIYPAIIEDKIFVVTAQNKRGPFNDADRLQISPDGKHFVYMALEETGDWYLNVDNERKFGPYEDSYLSVTFSPDSNHFAYLLEEGENDEEYLYQDGERKYGPFENISHIKYSPDNEHIYYFVRNGKDLMVMRDGEMVEKITYPNAEAQSLEVDQQGDYSYVVVSAKRTFIKYKDHKSKGFKNYRKIRPQIEFLGFSKDNSEVAYSVSYVYRKGITLLRNSDVQKLKYDSIQKAVYSPKASSFAYLGFKGNKIDFVLDGKVLHTFPRGDFFHPEQTYAISPDLNSFAYFDEKKRRVILNGTKEFAIYDEIEGLRFSDDGRKLAYNAFKKNEKGDVDVWWIVEEIR